MPTPDDCRRACEQRSLFGLAPTTASISRFCVGHAMDAPSYTNMIMQERVGEFWKMIGYVLLLWLLVSAAIVGLVRLLKRLFTSCLHRS
jgi:hypothetical protein